MIYWQGAVDICQVNLNILVHSNMILGRGHILHDNPHSSLTFHTEILQSKTSGLFQTEQLQSKSSGLFPQNYCTTKPQDCFKQNYCSPKPQDCFHRTTAQQNLRTVSNRTTAVQNLRTVYKVKAIAYSAAGYLFVMRRNAEHHS